jgi:hypothetical protein
LPGEAGSEHEVLASRHQLVEGRLLEGDAKELPDSPRLSHHVDPAHPRPAGGRSQQGREDADGRRLARAVAAEEAEDLAFIDGEADAPQRLHARRFVALGQVADLDGGRGAHLREVGAAKVNA